MKVDELQPSSLVRWSGHDGFPEWVGTTITWELGGAENGGTEVAFSHGGVAGGASSSRPGIRHLHPGKDRRSPEEVRGDREASPVLSAACPGLRYSVFSQTETWLLLSLVNGSRCQLLQRSRKVIPASRAIRSSSDGHT